MTRYEYIKTLPVETWAEWFSLSYDLRHFGCKVCPHDTKCQGPDGKCKDGLLAWLNQEVDENGIDDISREYIALIKRKS